MDIDTQTVVERRKYGAVVASFHLIGKVQTYSFEDLSDTSARIAKPLTGAGIGVGDGAVSTRTSAIRRGPVFLLARIAATQPQRKANRDTNADRNRQVR
jgi:hypothetical protein